MSAHLAFLLGSALASGTIVDVGGRTEGRVSLLSEPVADGFGAQLFALGLTPTLRAAWEDREYLVDVGYAPELSLIWPSREVAIAMHRGTTRMGWQPNGRVRASLESAWSIGDLDPGTAVRDLSGRSGGLVGGGGFTAFPFADALLVADVAWRPEARFVLNATTKLSATGSPLASEEEQAALPPQWRPEAAVGATWSFGGRDSISFDTALRSAVIGEYGAGGRYVGLAPTLSWNRQTANGIVTTTRGGFLVALADEGLKRNLLLPILPQLDVVVQTSLDLAAGSAIDGAMTFGLAPGSDPLGGLLEERLAASVQGGWRVNRDLSFSTSVGTFSTLAAIGANADQALENATAVAGSFGMAYALTDEINLEANAIGTSRVISDKFGRLSELRPEATFTVGVQGTWNAFHIGARPAGTDPRPGRNIGTRPVGVRGSSSSFQTSSGRELVALRKKKLKASADAEKQKRALEKKLGLQEGALDDRSVQAPAGSGKKRVKQGHKAKVMGGKAAEADKDADKNGTDKKAGDKKSGDKKSTDKKSGDRKAGADKNGSASSSSSASSSMTP